MLRAQPLTSNHFLHITQRVGSFDVIFFNFLRRRKNIQEQEKRNLACIGGVGLANLPDFVCWAAIVQFVAKSEQYRQIEHIFDSAVVFCYTQGLTLQWNVDSKRGG